LETLRQQLERRKFTVLLLSILVMTLLPLLSAGPETTGGLVRPDDRLNGLLWGVVLLAAVHAVADKPRKALLFSVAALVVFGGRLASVFGPNSSAQGAIDAGSYATGALFLFVTVVMVFRAILRAPHVTGDVVVGAVTVYMLIGYAWTNIYSLVWFLDNDAFKFPAYASMQGGTLIPEFTFGYYSFVTLTTLGYGDITPITYPARTLSWLEAVVGVAYMATVIAFLVSHVVVDKDAGREL